MIGPIRSILFVPGNRQDRFAKAEAAGADAVAFDLEDSVGTEQKEMARALVAEFLASPGGHALRLVRLNAVNTAEGEADLAFFSRARGFDGLILPKVESAESIEAAARAFTGDLPVGTAPPLLLQLETPRAILRAAEIVSADAPIGALVLGAEDLTASLAVERTVDGEELAYARAQVAMAAAAVGADAIDTVFTNLMDFETLRRDCERARGVGFRGKLAIHPKQVEIINNVFTPTDAVVERATKVIAAYDAARAAGKGVTTLDGQMVELPVVERARRTLALIAGRRRE
jgi:citrate lyase subunit beta/citryl-CoA lyase